MSIYAAGNQESRKIGLADAARRRVNPSDIQAGMLKAFINSDEYRRRFGP